MLYLRFVSPSIAPSDYVSTRARTAQVGDVVLGRYRLVEAIGHLRGTSLWHGHDQHFDRPVSIRLAPLDSPITSELRRAAQRASGVDDVHASRLLDIANDRALDALVIVTEFSKGLTLSDILVIERGRPLSTVDAVTIAHEVALLLVDTHSHGVYHGSITPDCVVITLTGEVRLVGLEVDEVLNNHSPEHDRALADVHAVGAILYAGLTGQWPDPIDELETAGSSFARQGLTLRPAQVATGVPPELDELVARALQPPYAPEVADRFTSVAQVETALAAWTRETEAAATRTSRPALRTTRRGRRLKGMGVALGVLMSVSLVGLALALGVGSEPLTKPKPPSAPSAVKPSPTK